MTLQVREISREEHLAAAAALPSVSFLQTPAWGEVKREWKAQSLGWFAGKDLVGTALVLYRQMPRIRRYFAYIPEGPVLDWSEVPSNGLSRWLQPLVDHVRRHGAFAVRIGPPVPMHRWRPATVKAALADSSVTRLNQVEPDVTNPVSAAVTAELTALGWRPFGTDGGFTAGQPKYVFQVPLAGRTEESLFAGFNQLWRRNIRKAEKSGVKVSLGTAEDLPEFHALYTDTARRDGFTPRSLAYFQGMWQAMTNEAEDRLRLYLARHEGDLVAATTLVRVGDHAWYSYGASSTTKRDVRGSNAVQWHMMRDSLADRCTVYDLRGITETLDEHDPHVGLVRFKLGSGGEAVELVGEWDLPISKVLYTAFDLYLKRRG